MRTARMKTPMFDKDGVHGLPRYRLWLLRVPYVLTGIVFSFTAWSTLIRHWGRFDPIEGVAFAFWGALSLLALLGIRFPVKMLPIILLQFAYKLIWICAVGYPLLDRGALDPDGQELLRANLIGVAIDTLAIPWLYCWRVYVVDLPKVTFNGSSHRS